MSHYLRSDTRDVRLFAAVSAMGVPWTEAASVDGAARTWTFGDVSDCGRWKIGELIRWWKDGRFHVNNGDHPFHVVKCVMLSDKGLRESFRNGSGFRQEAKGKCRVIKPAAVPEAGVADHTTHDASFAAALSATGFEVRPAGSVGTTRVMGVADWSTSFGYTWADALRWWRDETFERDNGQHPFAYAKAAAVTYRAAIDAIKKERPLVRWQPKDAIGWTYIHPDCPKETEEYFAKKMQGL